VTFFRICRAGFDRPATAFNGEGATKVAHRWNHAGPDLRAVYGSDSLALACLECLVHLRPLPRFFPKSVYYAVEVPDKFLEQPSRSALPKGWDAAVPGPAARDFGTAFLRSRRAVGLVVPTAIQPLGLNVVLNPLHPDFSLRWVSGPLPYPFDHRLE
jgi:RES domain-containing protein